MSHPTASTTRIQHLVQFGYRPETTDEERSEIAAAFLALKRDCRIKDNLKDPDSPEGEGQGQGEPRPYILSLVGGANNSTEGLADGLEHAYIVTFASIADRDYYNETDPAHQAFKALVGPKVSKVVVLDFEEGRF